MSLDAKETKSSFGKGTLPGWATVILLGLIAYMFKGTMEDFRDAKNLGVATDKRVTVLELQTKSTADSITELRLSNKDILSELKAMNVGLQNRK